MSVQSEILSQAIAAIQGLNLAGSPTVLGRKRFIVNEDDTFPLVIVCPEPEEEEGEDEMELTLVMSYPLFVGIALSPGNLEDSTQETDMFTYRQTIRRALRSVNVLTPSECTVLNVRASLNPQFDRPASLDRMDASGMIFTYTIAEPRVT